MNVPGIVGLGVACALCQAEMTEESHRIVGLRDQLEELLISRIPDLHRNGDLNHRLPGNSSLRFPGIDAEALIANVPELSLSAGSACTSGTPAPLHVLLAIGLSRQEAQQTVRVGVGRYTTEEEITMTSQLIENAVKRILAVS
jgi:cysteine desulfurase